MKLRQNFVSNSSSASFVLETELTKEKFLELIRSEFFYDVFAKEDILSELNQHILLEEDCLESSEDITLKEIIMGNLKRMKERKERIEKLSEDSNDYYNEILPYRQLNIEENPDKTVNIRGWTIMWNGIQDLGTILPYIVSLLVLEREKIRLRVEKD